MAHEVDKASTHKCVIGWENGRPVYADVPSTESDADDETDATDATTESLGHEDNDASDE